MNENSRYIDWRPILNSIPDTEQKTILELGCGSGTKYLVKSFKHVYSYETNSRDPNGDWFNVTHKENTPSNKWDGKFVTEFSTIKSHITDLPVLLKDILQFVSLNKIDVVFVDPGFAQRAECVLFFMKHNVPYIFTHDTNTEPNLYNWKLLHNTPNYSLIEEIKTGQGTQLYKRNE